MGIPIITYTVKLAEVNPEGRYAVAVRRAEDLVETIKVAMPAAISVLEETNHPRRASLDGIFRGGEGQRRAVEQGDHPGGPEEDRAGRLAHHREEDVHTEAPGEGGDL